MEGWGAVGGWLKSSQPHLLTVAAATLQSKSSRDRQPGGLGLPRSGEGGRGAGGGRRPGRVQYWRGKNNTAPASRPSHSPGARNPALHRWKPDQPENPGRAGELGSPWRPERLGARKRVKGW